jgi:hypothetical protein
MRRRALCGAIAVSGVAPSLAAPRGSVADDSGGVGADYFGMHFHRLVRPAGELVAPTAWPEQAEVGALRLWDSGTRWGDLAPRPGRWDFERMDAYVERAVAQRAALLYTLGSTPRWASARPDEAGPYGPGCAAEPERLADWVDYLQRVTQRYRGAIRAYELWNEPHFSDLARDRAAPGFFTGSVAAMVEMARSARQVIAAVDPQARLATPGFVNGSDRLELFLAAGGAASVDAVAYHFYADSAARFAAQIAEVRGVMQRRRCASLPLWNTECGVETHDTLDETAAAARLGQFLLLGAAARLARFDYYAWDNSRSGMVDAQGQPHTRLVAWRQVRAWLLGTRLGSVEWGANGVVRIAGERDAERFVFAWAEQDSRVALPVPRGWRVAAVERMFEAPVSAPASAQGTVLALSTHPLRVQLLPLNP